jgi:hypothetical protein
MLKTLALLTLFLAATGATPAAAGDDDAPELSFEGLQLVEKTRNREFYADPDADWSEYTQVRLDPATVAFRKNWQRDQNRMQPFKVKTKDMERIKADLAELFDEVFAEELSGEGGYDLTTEAGENVMRITPHIVDLDVYAPDTPTPSRTYQYSESAGRMTLKLDIFDSVTGDLIATFRDRQEDPRLGWMEWRTRVSNRADAERMLKRWATRLRELLDEVRSQQAAAG